MFSLGATLMHMITGKTPVWLEAMGMYHFPKSPKLKTVLSTDGLHFCSSLLHKSPDKRPTASQALKHPWLAKDKENEFVHLDGKRKNNLTRHSMRSKLQRCARTNYVVHSSLLEEHLVGIESEFCSMVSSSIGEINYKELQLSLQLRNSLEAANLLQGLDADGTGTIAFSEWLVASCPDDVFQDPTAARRAFDTLDSDGDGFISAKDLYIVLPGVFSEEEIFNEMMQHDSDSDGYICFDDFRELLEKEAPDAPLHL
jgi:calcium-dependent protein kinase